jgi:hypothetical protein
MNLHALGYPKSVTIFWFMGFGMMCRSNDTSADHYYDEGLISNCVARRLIFNILILFCVQVSVQVGVWVSVRVSVWVNLQVSVCE